MILRGIKREVYENVWREEREIRKWCYILISKVESENTLKYKNKIKNMKWLGTSGKTMYEI